MNCTLFNGFTLWLIFCISDSIGWLFKSWWSFRISCIEWWRQTSLRSNLLCSHLFICNFYDGLLLGCSDKYSTYDYFLMPELVTLNEDRCFTRKHWFSRTSFLVSVASHAKRKKKSLSCSCFHMFVQVILVWICAGHCWS